ncbi:MAG: histidine phosphatase family protein [Ancalomicrobiaceae bacterium]|nr:histidine phosphatase family protein [Ancalomicrobiaceae bacterium]
MRKLWLIRHGAVVGDAHDRYIGRTDLPMSHDGEASIERIAAFLRPEPLDLVLASDLARSRRTAEILVAGRHVPIRVLPALAEIDMGDWEGALRSDIAHQHPEAWTARGLDIVGFRPPGGESFADLAARVVPVLECLADWGTDLSVAIAGHAGVNRTLLCHLLGMPLEALFRIAQPHGAISLIEWHRGTPTVQLLGARCGET